MLPIDFLHLQSLFSLGMTNLHLLICSWSEVEKLVLTQALYIEKFKNQSPSPMVLDREIMKADIYFNTISLH